MAKSTVLYLNRGPAALSQTQLGVDESQVGQEATLWARTNSPLRWLVEFYHPDDGRHCVVRLVTGCCRMTRRDRALFAP
jgi:hypothetical protein